MALVDDLVAYWSLDEASGNAIDAHGSNDLTDTNTVGAATGKVSGARDFERDNSEQFSLASNAALQSGDIDFTITAWVNLESKAGDMQIVTKYGNAVNEYAILYQSGGSPSDRFRFYFGTSFSNVAATTLGSPSTGTWYFICAWHDSTANTINISVNNGATNSQGSITASSAGNATFRIGNRDSVSEFFDGLIDEVGYWKRVLTSDERTELYNSGNGRDYSYITGGGGGGTTGEEFQKHNPYPRRFHRRQAVAVDFAPLLAGPSTTDCGLLLEDGGGLIAETGGEPIALEGCPAANADQPPNVLGLPGRPPKQAVPYQ